jgi:DNA-binding NarL/FixJ family response regulator
MRRLKVLVADDHRLMLEAVRMALRDENDIEIVGETCNGSQVLPLVNDKKPDVVLLDIRMPGMDGLHCLEGLRQRHPDVRCVVLSGVDDPAVVEAAFDRGAVAFILKHVDPRDIPSAIRQAAEGTVVHAARGRSSPAHHDPAKEAGLTERETAILTALGSGMSNKQIARHLWLAEQTVKFHLTNIYRKLGVASRAEAIHYAYGHGLIGNPLLDELAAAAR